MPTLIGYDKRTINHDIALDLPGFEGIGDTVHDVSKYRNNGTLVGVTWDILASGQPVLSFPGAAGNRVEAHSTLVQIAGLATGTALCWFRNTDVGIASRIIMSASDIADPSSEWTLQNSATGGTQRFAAFSRQNGGGLIRVYSTTPIIPDVWYLGGFVVTATGNQLYLNGLPEVGDYISGDVNTSSFISAVTGLDVFHLGINQDSGGYELLWMGNLSRPRISPMSYTSAEMLDVFQRERHLFGV